MSYCSSWLPTNLFCFFLTLHGPITPQKTRSTRRSNGHTLVNTYPSKEEYHPPLDCPGSHGLFVSLIGRGWPINAPVLGPDHWLSARWWSVKCAINPGHGPQHIRVAGKAWQRAPLTWVSGKSGFTGPWWLIQLGIAQDILFFLFIGRVLKLLTAFLMIWLH